MTPSRGKHGASEEESHYHYLHFTDEEVESSADKATLLKSYGYLSPSDFPYSDPFHWGCRESRLAIYLARGQVEGDNAD